MNAHSVKTNVTYLHIQGKSPTVYKFNLTVTDEHNLTSSDVVLVTVTKGLCVCVCLYAMYLSVYIFYLLVCALAICIYVCVVCMCVCRCSVCHFSILS